MPPDEIIEEIRYLTSLFYGEEEWRHRKPRYERIIREGEKTVKYLPTHYELGFQLARAYNYYRSWYIKGDARRPYLLKAVEHFATAIEAGKENQKQEAAFECGVILTEEALVRDLRRAARLLEFVIEDEKTYHPAHCLLARAYKRDGQLAKAIVAYERAIEVIERSLKTHDPCIAPAPFEELAKIYLRRGKFKEAANVIGRFENAHGSLLPEHLKLLGDALFGMGKYREAKAVWERARKLEPRVVVKRRLRKVARRLTEDQATRRV